MLDRISTAMAGKPALRAHANSDQSFFLAFSGPFTHPFHRFHNSRLHLIDVLHLREFACDDPQDHILVLRQILQRFEATSSWGIVLQVVSMHI